MYWIDSTDDEGIAALVAALDEAMGYPRPKVDTEHYTGPMGPHPEDAARWRVPVPDEALDALAKARETDKRVASLPEHTKELDPSWFPADK